MLPSSLCEHERRGQRRAGATPAPADWSSLNDWPTGNQAIDDHNYRDYQQEVDQPATDMHDKKSEHPQDEENYRNSPKHDGILVRSELRRARWQRACLSF